MTGSPDAVELLSMMSSPCVEGIATTDFDSGLGVLPCSADDVLDRTRRQSDNEVSSASDLSSADDCPPSTSNEFLLNFFLRESSESGPLCSNHPRPFEIFRALSETNINVKELSEFGASLRSHLDSVVQSSR